jgi:hypothetical protein
LRFTAAEATAATVDAMVAGIAAAVAVAVVTPAPLVRVASRRRRRPARSASSPLGPRIAVMVLHRATFAVVATALSLPTATAPPVRERATARVAGEVYGLAATPSVLWVSVPADNLLLRLDPRTGRRLGRVVLWRLDRRAFGGGALATGAGALWIAAPVSTSDGPRDVTGWIGRLDLRTNRLRVQRVTSGQPVAVALGGAGVWVTGGKRLWRLDPRDGRIVESVALRRPATAIAVGRDSVWAQSPRDGVVLRIDPGTRRVTARIRIGRTASFGSLALGSRLWAAVGDAVVAVDPRTNRVVRRVAIPSPNAVAVDGDRVWVYAEYGLYTVGAGARADRRVAFAERSLGALAARGGGVWISDGVQQVLRRFAGA